MLQTRPRPLRDRLHDLGTNGVAQHVAQHGEQVVILLNRKTFEAALPDMAMTPVMPMIAAYVARHPPLHERTQRVSGLGLQHEVKMIRHEAEAQDANPVLGFGHLQQGEERRVVGIFVKYDRAAVAAIEYMVGVSSQLSTGNARHTPGQYGMRGVAGKGKVACPSFLPPRFLIPCRRIVATSRA